MSSDDRLEILRAEARYHRERHALYRAKVYGLRRPTSMTRLRELERASALAEERLRAAEAAQAKIQAAETGSAG
jgi:hypothetical protein